MSLCNALRRNGTWKTRLVLGTILIGPLYLLPVLLRSLLNGWWEYAAGALLSDFIGCAVVGFLTNNYRLGILLYLAATGCELLLLIAQHPVMSLWLGDLIPALVVIYYAQQLFINIGD